MEQEKKFLTLKTDFVIMAKGLPIKTGYDACWATSIVACAKLLLMEDSNC
jgi:hypothetical protein